MLSRVANSIHWMSRYLERAENIARFVDVNLHLILDVPVAFEYQWAPLVSVTGDAATFNQRYEQATQDAVLQFLVFDRDNPNSIYSCMAAARENARSTREVISSDMWEQVNRTYLMVRDAESSKRIWTEAAAFFSHFKKACHLFNGITDATMTHNEAWHFNHLGRHLERADKTSRILDVKYFILLPKTEYVGSPYDSLQWMALLKSASAFEMYRKRYQRITPRHVAEFLILDPGFPRSIRHCVGQAEDSLKAIAGTAPRSFHNRAEQRMGRLRAELDYTSTDDIFNQGMHEYLDDIQGRLNTIGQAVHGTFFESAEPATMNQSQTQRQTQRQES